MLNSTARYHGARFLLDLFIDLIDPDIQRNFHWTMPSHVWTNPYTSDLYVNHSGSAEKVLDQARRVLDELLRNLILPDRMWCQYLEKTDDTNAISL